MITLQEIERRPGIRQVQTALDAFLKDRPRLQKLCRYAQAQHDILARTRPHNLPNARLPHGFPKYLAEMSAGYLLGDGVRYTAAKDEEGARNYADLLNKAGDDSLDMDLAMQQGVYGRGVSLCWQDAHLHVSALDPQNAFVVYDDTARKKPLMGILLSFAPRGDTMTTVYTDRDILTFLSNNPGNVGRMTSAIPHDLGRVPMVEFFNNAGARGDFEDVLPLVDAYDLLASDRLNDRGQFADAMLVLTGVGGLGTQGEPDDRQEAARLLRQERTLSLPDAQAKAEWLVKNANEKDIDVLRKALADDIHKFSMTPNLAPDGMGGDFSAIAIRYRLFALEQKTRIKERWFIQGLRQQARLLCAYLAAQGIKAPDPEGMGIMMNRPKICEAPNR